MLPCQRHTTKIRFIADLIIKVVKAFQFGDEFAHQLVLDCEQFSILVQSVGIRPGNGANSVDVIDGVHRAESPHALFIKRAEKV